MRRTFEEFSAEVYRRRDFIKEKQRHRAWLVNRIAPIALCFVMCITVAVFVMPLLLKGNIIDGELNGGLGDDSNSVDNADGDRDTESNGGYVIAISYLSVEYGDESIVYSDADDIWEVFLYVEDYPEDFRYYGKEPFYNSSTYYKVTVRLRDGTTHYYILNRVNSKEIADGLSELMSALDKTEF